MSDLQTPRLVLHPVDLAEGARIAAGSAGPDDLWAPDYPFEGDRGAAGAFVRAAEASGPQQPFGYHRIDRRSDGLAIGGIGFKGAPDADGAVEVGYGLAPSARGHGYTAEALTALLAVAARAGARRVVAQTTPDNLASQRTLLRAGFRLVDPSGALHRFETVLALRDAPA